MFKSPDQALALMLREASLFLAGGKARSIPRDGAMISLLTHMRSVGHHLEPFLGRRGTPPMSVASDQLFDRLAQRIGLGRGAEAAYDRPRPVDQKFSEVP